jgi:hypothetical protein
VLVLLFAQYVLPDYDTPVECVTCAQDGERPLYEPSWVGEMFNWGSNLPIYNKTRQEQLRIAQGLYTQDGEQTTLGDPTDVNALTATPEEEDGGGGEVGAGGAPTDATVEASTEAATAIQVVDVSALVSEGATAAERQRAADELSASFSRTGFALIRGHGVHTSTVEGLRAAAQAFFASDEKHAYDRGRGYGHGGYVRHQEAGAQLLGDFARPRASRTCPLNPHGA